MRYIIGVGNASMSDDSIGLRIVEHIAERGLEREFEAVSIADEGMRLLFYLTGETEKIVLVDAVDLGLPPGEWRLFRPDEARTEKKVGGLTTHEGDILRVLELARNLGYPIPPTIVLGIQPGCLEPGLDLSPALQDRLAIYVRTALEEVRRDAERSDS